MAEVRIPAVSEMLFTTASDSYRNVWSASLFSWLPFVSKNAENTPLNVLILRSQTHPIWLAEGAFKFSFKPVTVQFQYFYMNFLVIHFKQRILQLSLRSDKGCALVASHQTYWASSAYETSQDVNVAVSFKAVGDLKVDFSGRKTGKEDFISPELLVSFFHVEGTKIIHGAVGERK